MHPHYKNILLKEIALWPQKRVASNCRGTVEPGLFYYPELSVSGYLTNFTIWNHLYPAIHASQLLFHFPCHPIQILLSVNVPFKVCFYFLSGEVRSPGVYEPEENLQSIRIGEFELQFFTRFRHQSILVDSCTNKHPTKVWFLPHTEIGELKHKKNYVRVVYKKVPGGGRDYFGAEDGIDYSLCPKRFSRPDCISNERDLQTVLQLFEDMACCFEWQFSPNTEEVCWATVKKRREYTNST